MKHFFKNICVHRTNVVSEMNTPPEYSSFFLLCDIFITTAEEEWTDWKKNNDGFLRERLFIGVWRKQKV
ncbi:MAG: hypothetical protein A2756_03375 [Candidatus Ryanbacteria bacterium RIFCSPHIGHO2_01_FULL_48_27]|uniref:Uncharacterized protein n=1 Tax=Candidatus Ryanbacteria bacterium RIFCSPHIGHO2_01_FULL_48_27 TaxID=1802115 RepID=A0A1G2G4L8_9BACT|nr:MAG: hypothetical protein A2756_03375 [Candidatus Ryanbacteria bacterium RIFCSPHIGHO2_01_FULL_48_27]